MIEFENLRGRLYGLRSLHPVTMDDIFGLGGKVATLGMRTTGQWVFAVDLRRCGIMKPEVSDALVELHRRDNPRTERIGLLLPESNATFSLQVERVLRESGGTKRRAFREPSKLAVWLSEVLAADEVAILPPFLERGSEA